MPEQTNTDQFYHSLTLEEAKALTWRDTLYSLTHYNRKGQPDRWRVNGKVRLWKRTPARVQVPVKHGLYSFDQLTERDLTCVTLSERYAIDQRNA